MNRDKMLVGVLLGISLYGCSSGTKAPRPGPDVGLGSAAWIVPVDVANSSSPSQNDWLNLGWQTFIALNWPAVAPQPSTNRGQPDTGQALGAKAQNSAFIPTVWLTYRGDGDTFLAGGANPQAWNSAVAPPPAGCPVGPLQVAPGFQPLVLDQVAKSTSDPDINEASGNPLIDQSGWYVIYDIRLNQSEYTFIQQNGYYDAVNQINSFQNGGSGINPFPRTGQEAGLDLPPYAQFGSLEVKTSWRVLNPAKDDVSRYYTQAGYFLQPDSDGCQGPALFGLVGLHILRLTPTTPSTWFWASFEQVDNTEVPAGSTLKPSFAQPGTPNGDCTAQYNQAPPVATGDIPWAGTNPPVNVCRVTPIPSDVAQANAFWQNEVAGTVWANYQMVNTLNPVSQGQQGYTFPPIKSATNLVNLPVLANSTLETYSQDASCMSCHGFAAPQGAPQPLTGANQIFTFLLSNAQSSSPQIKKQRRPDFSPGLREAAAAAHR
jgi:hypothetical protein